MKAVKTSFIVIIVLVIFGGSSALFTNYYSILFSRRVVGVIQNVERVNLEVALMQTPGVNEKINPALYSFAVAIKEKTGEIVTASAEDRQWAVVQPGQCAEAVYYPYPPWKFDKANTYFGARLEKLTDCSH